MSKNFLLNKKIFVSKKLDDPTHKFLKNICDGVEVIDIPTIRTVPVNDYREFDNLLSKFNNFSYLIFTSANAVAYFSKRINELEIDLSYSEIKTVAVGEKTASACSEAGIPVNIIPSVNNSEGIVNELEELDINNLKILIPGSKLSGNNLKKSLTLRKAKVYQVPTYDVDFIDDEISLSKLKRIVEDKADIFIFTSPSSFNNFLKLAGFSDAAEYFKDSYIVAIGPTTKRAIESNKIKVDFMPSKFSIKDIFDELTRLN